jgi:hypothetical protein
MARNQLNWFLHLSDVVWSSYRKKRRPQIVLALPAWICKGCFVFCTTQWMQRLITTCYLKNKIRGAFQWESGGWGQKSAHHQEYRWDICGGCVHSRFICMIFVADLIECRLDAIQYYTQTNTPKGLATWQVLPPALCAEDQTVLYTCFLGATRTKLWRECTLADTTTQLAVMIKRSAKATCLEAGIISNRYNGCLQQWKAVWP